MTALLGNTETRSVYKNFHFENLNTNAIDSSHLFYQKYLQYNKFVPPGENQYFVHTINNTVPTPPVTNVDKGLFNLFPLDLSSDELKIPSTNLGNHIFSPFIVMYL
jgi:hypothetical protein